MRRLIALVFVALACSTAAGAAVQTSATNVTASQLTARFKKATGDKLRVNPKASYSGHYRAFDLGPPSIATKAKYGTFTVYLVTGADVQAEVTNLLADAHTGVLGTPGPGNIYWEAGTTIYGDKYWLAKRLYGANVVLWWIGSQPVKKTDRTFKRLHVALTAVTR